MSGFHPFQRSQTEAKCGARDQVLQTLRHLLPRRLWVTCQSPSRPRRPSRKESRPFRREPSRCVKAARLNSHRIVAPAAGDGLGATHVSQPLLQTALVARTCQRSRALTIMPFDKGELWVKCRRWPGSSCQWQEVKWHFRHLILMVRCCQDTRRFFYFLYPLCTPLINEDSNSLIMMFIYTKI